MSGDLDRPLAKQAALLLAMLALIAYWPMLRGRVPFPADIVLQFPPWESVRPPDFQFLPHAEMGDLATEMYPWKSYTRRAAANGTVPLWNPYLLFGTTFVGDPQPALFYPPTLLYALLPTPLAWSLFFLFRTVVGGLLVTLLARDLGANRPGALFSGVVFAFCGWVTAFQTRPHLDTAMWLALVLLAVDRLRKRPSPFSVALTAVAFALPVLAGQPESAAHVTFVGLAFFLYRFALPSSDEGAGRLPFVGAFVAAGLLALGLAAIQVLPTLEFIGQLDRGLDAPWGSKPLSEIAAFLSRDLGSTPNSAGVPIPEGAAYAGMLTLLLAPLALLHRNRRDAVFFLALLAAVLSIVYGWGPVYALSLHTPILRGIPNGRLLVVADLALAVLAGLGLTSLVDRLRTARRPGRLAWLLTMPVAALAAAGILVIRERGRIGFQPHPFLSLRTIRGPASSAAILLGAALLLGLALTGRLRPERLAVLAVLFVAADLVSASYRFIRFARPADIFPPAPTFRFLASDPQPHRVAAVDHTYGSGFDFVYGLESLGGFNVIPRRTLSMLSTFGFANDAPAFSAEKIVGLRGRLLDLMNVKYLVTTTLNRSAGQLASQPERFRLAFSDRSVRVFENLTVLPRAFLVPLSGALAIPSESAQLERVRAADFDPLESVILGERTAAVPAPPGAPVAGSRADVVDAGSNGIRLRAAAGDARVLVLSQTYYPGWKVFVDGREQPVVRVDYGLAGTVLSAGEHDVRFVYSPRSLKVGAALTAASLIVCAVLWRRGRVS
jgi:Bacterial membrane protein YfhO